MGELRNRSSVASRRDVGVSWSVCGPVRTDAFKLVTRLMIGSDEFHRPNVPLRSTSCHKYQFHNISLLCYVGVAFRLFIYQFRDYASNREFSTQIEETWALREGRYRPH